MKQRNLLTVSTLRMLIAAIKNKKIELRDACDEGAVFSVVKRELKKRKEAAILYERAGDAERASKEMSEAAIVQSYMPAELSDDELRQVVAQALKDVGASSAQDAGRVIGAVMKRLQGTADGQRVKEMVQQALR